MDQFGAAVMGRLTDDSRQRLEQLEAAMADAGDLVESCRELFAILTPAYFADAARLGSSRGDVCDDPPAALRNQGRINELTLASLGDWDWRPALKTLNVPALVIHGSADPIPLAAAREWAATLPLARLLVIDDSGHFPFVEQPQAFFTAVDQFLGGQWPMGAVRISDQ
jgi:pimeloyl-ACP methyl ester carboxylesterase